MSIDLEWEDERGKSLARVEDPGSEFAQALLAADLAQTTCLRFVDPYGDTVFNQMQIPELIAELEHLVDCGASETLTAMIELAERSRGKAHTYLKFLGD